MASDCETNIKFVPCDDINAVDPSLGQFIIEGDKLYRVSKDPNFPQFVDKELILTKEAFIECCKQWISLPLQETKPTLESMSLMNDYKL